MNPIYLQLHLHGRQFPVITYRMCFKEPSGHHRWACRADALLELRTA